MTANINVINTFLIMFSTTLLRKYDDKAALDVFNKSKVYDSAKLAELGLYIESNGIDENTIEEFEKSYSLFTDF